MRVLPDCVVPDSSVIIDGQLSSLLADDESDHCPRVIIPEAVVSELVAQANSDRTSGWLGLDELQALVALDESDSIEVEYAGELVSPSDIAGAGHGDIDALIRQIADEWDATLFTSDTVQAEAARARGIPVEHLNPTVVTEDFAVESFFDETTMSVHLKSNTLPKAKAGALGDVTYAPIDDSLTTPEQMEEWATEIESVASASPDGFVELSKPGMTIIQIRDYRVAIARPPFSDGIEITAVKPISKTTLDDYDAPEGLIDRFTEQKRGVLISGSPGAGKSTFAQAVGEYLDEHGVVVKTMEQPRDLQVGPDITQYTALDGRMENTADSLLLVRPDYTIYDEVRKTSDFDVFSDMRLAGVGMIGVVHATRAIDALQRLVGRVELGLIPQIVDTVVYIESGEIHTVYDIETAVKVPEGMNSEDLARPVIQVCEYETGTPVYEVYTFNRQVVTVDVNETEGDSEETTEPQQSSHPGAERIQHAVKSIGISGTVEVENTGPRSATVYVEQSAIPRVIGNGGSQISAIEDRLDVELDVKGIHEKP